MKIANKDYKEIRITTTDGYLVTSITDENEIHESGYCVDLIEETSDIQLREAAGPLIELLKTNYDSHTEIVVRAGSIVLKQDVRGILVEAG